MSIFIELMAADAALKSWLKNPSQTKKEMGLFSGWKMDKSSNKKPLTKQEVNGFVSLLKKHHPSSNTLVEFRRLQG